MIPKSLQDYVKIYKDFLDPSLCLAATRGLEKAEWQMHAFYDYSTNQNIKYENELSVTHQQIPEKKEIDSLVWKALEKYILNDFKDFREWFNGWNGYSLVRFNKYDPKTQMKLHCDHIHSLFQGDRKGVPILTVLGSLNNEYTGGELIMWDDEVIDLPAGSVVVFPSNFMYPHEVRPVKTGVRYSFVSWAW